MGDDGLVERQASPSEPLLHDDAEALAVSHHLPAGRTVALLGWKGAQLGLVQRPSFPLLGSAANAYAVASSSGIVLGPRSTGHSSD